MPPGFTETAINKREEDEREDARKSENSKCARESLTAIVCLCGARVDRGNFYRETC